MQKIKEWIDSLIKHFLKLEFVRFGLVGILNTLVDFGLLNILMFTTHISGGFWYAIFKCISYMSSVIVSFILNKKWTFKSKNQNAAIEVIKFITVTFATLLINVGISLWIVQNNVLGLNSYLWGNIAAFSGAVITIFMRYFGFKFWVF